MISILLNIVLVSNGIVSLITPWIGIVLAFLFAVMAPQNIWWWAFVNVRPIYFILLPTLVGTGVLILKNKIRYDQINNRIIYCILILWLCFTISYYFGPYVKVFNKYRFYDVEFMFQSLQKTYVTFLVGAILIDNVKKLKVFSLVIIITVVYMTYWANAQYLFYGKYGRLHGPTPLIGSSIYSDENNFAVLFVVGIPFIFYLGKFIKNKTFKWVIWSVVPFGWHAIFLTGSRGALLGIAAVLLLYAFRNRNKIIGIGAILFFMIFFVWQAGDIMKERSATIDEFSTEESAASRIEAWKAAIGMMMAHPITGVGIASFGQAFKDFSKIEPRIAHNTFFQIGGEWGIPAAITYVTLITILIYHLILNSRFFRSKPLYDKDSFILYINEACLLGLVGFVVCSFFLSLEKFEIFYYLIIIGNCIYVHTLRCKIANRKLRSYHNKTK